MSAEFEFKKKLLEKLLPNLLCMSCKTPPRPDGPGRSRHACSHCGGGVCGDCFKQSDLMCKSYSKKDCNGQIGKALHLTTEDTLKEMPFACKNYQHGCRDICHENLHCHEKECSHRLIHCADLVCKEKVPLIEYSAHVKNHKRTFLSVLCGNEQKEMLNHRLAQLSVLDIKSFAFFAIDISARFGAPFYLSRLFENGQYFSWIYYLGSSEGASRYIYTMTVTNPRDRDEKITYSGRVRSMDESPEALNKEKIGFLMNVAQFNRFKEEDKNEVYFTLTIQDTKEEAKDDNEDSGLSDEESKGSN